MTTDHDRQREAPTVHYRGSFNFHGVEYARCGAPGKRITDDIAAVTCKRCHHCIGRGFKP